MKRHPPRNRQITLRDVAELLKVSVSTVSAALQNRSDISQRTRERVWQAVRKLNYQPNLVARSLVTRQTHVLGVVVPDLSRSFFTEVTKGIEAIASQAGYHLVICNTGEDPQREDAHVETLISKRVDGLLVASAHDPAFADGWKRLTSAGIPFVLIDRFFPNVSFVGGDDEKIGYIATKHLIGLGCRDIAHLRGPNVSTALGRLNGYLKALRKSGLRVRRDQILEAHYHEEQSGQEAMRKLLRLSARPDAVFAASDPIAIGAMQAILAAGLRIPTDVAVVGVGNHRYTQYLRVPLSTVDQNRVEIGRKAASVLIDSVQRGDNGKPRVLLIKPKLIPRASTVGPVEDDAATLLP